MIEFDRLQLRLIDAEYRRRPCYGGRRMVVSLRAQGHPVNHQRLIRVLGLAGMAPGPQTSKPHPEHKVFPYRLRGLAITRPNPVWNTDITLACLAHGFAYRVAMLDGYSRRVLAWRLSNTLESSFCIDSLEGRCADMAVWRFSTPIRARSSPAGRSPRYCRRRAGARQPLRRTALAQRQV